jgi:hypothetical protein
MRQPDVVARCVFAVMSGPQTVALESSMKDVQWPDLDPVLGSQLLGTVVHDNPPHDMWQLPDGLQASEP